MKPQLSPIDMPPNEAMRLVLQNAELPFHSIVALRRVCRRLRQLIDDIKPSIDFKRLELKFAGGWISMAFLIGDKRIETQYHSYEKKCIVWFLNEAGNGVIEKFDEDDYMDIFFSNLEFILKYSNPTQLHSFFLKWFNDCDTSTRQDISKRNEHRDLHCSRFFKKFNDLLMSIHLTSSLLKIEELEMRNVTIAESLMMLSYIDPKILVKISLSPVKWMDCEKIVPGKMDIVGEYGKLKVEDVGNTNKDVCNNTTDEKLADDSCDDHDEVVNSDEVVSFSPFFQLEQWNSAKKLDISEYRLSDSIDNFAHFADANITVISISSDDLAKLKEIFIRSPEFQNFRIRFETFTNRLNLHTVLDRPCLVKQDSGNVEEFWYFLVNKTDDQIISVMLSKDVVLFSRTIWSQVPGEAEIIGNNMEIP